MTKYEILEHLAHAGDSDAKEVAAAFGIPYPAAGMALLRLSRQGLITRCIDPHREIYWYRLSHRGKKRLRYFQRVR